MKEIIEEYGEAIIYVTIASAIMSFFIGVLAVATMV